MAAPITIAVDGLDKRDRPRAALLLWRAAELAAAQPNPGLAAWLERLAQAIDVEPRRRGERPGA